MYGTQAVLKTWILPFRFENDVKMYGTQAKGEIKLGDDGFENDVKMYGTQAQLRDNAVVV